MTTEAATGLIGLAAVLGIGYLIWQRNTGYDDYDDYDEPGDVVWYEEWHYEERWEED